MNKSKLYFSKIKKINKKTPDFLLFLIVLSGLMIINIVILDYPDIITSETYYQKSPWNNINPNSTKDILSGHILHVGRNQLVIIDITTEMNSSITILSWNWIKEENNNETTLIYESINKSTHRIELNHMSKFSLFSIYITNLSNENSTSFFGSIQIKELDLDALMGPIISFCLIISYIFSYLIIKRINYRKVFQKPFFIKFKRHFDQQILLNDYNIRNQSKIDIVFLTFILWIGLRPTHLITIYRTSSLNINQYGKENLILFINNLFDDFMIFFWIFLIFLVTKSTSDFIAKRKVTKELNFLFTLPFDRKSFIINYLASELLFYGKYIMFVLIIKFGLYSIQIGFIYPIGDFVLILLFFITATASIIIVGVLFSSFSKNNITATVFTITTCSIYTGYLNSVMTGIIKISWSSPISVILEDINLFYSYLELEKWIFLLVLTSIISLLGIIIIIVNINRLEQN